MTERHNIMINADGGQILHYTNPRFRCIASLSSCRQGIYPGAGEHWHEELEYLIVSDGALDVSVNGTTFRVNEGEGVFINSRRVHANKSASGNPCVFYCVLLHPSILGSSAYLEEQYLLPMTSPESFDYLKLTHHDWTGELMDDILRIFADDDSSMKELEILETAWRQIRMIMKHIPPVSRTGNAMSAYVEAFKQMVTCIEQRCSEKLTLREIAAAGNVGTTLCAKIFRQMSGKNPGEYLISYRISQGMYLLNRTSLSVTEIAYQTGFSSASHFTKTFHLLTGTTPLRYREEHGNVAQNKII